MSSAALTPILLALPSLTPSLAIEIIPYGLTVHKIYAQTDGKTHDLIIGPEKAADFQNANHKYHNTIVGRYSNRLPTGDFELERNGITSLFACLPNSEKNPKVSLHGGPKGFDDVEWEVLDPFSSQLFSDSEKVSIGSMPTSAVFRHISEDGDQGFPGKLLVEVLIGLLNPGQANAATSKGEYSLGSIVFVYRAKLLDEGKKVVTPINLTQHWGFNLEASLKEEPSNQSVKDHTLTMKAANTIDLDEFALSTGKLNPVSGTPHDHSSKLIGDRFPQNGYDEFYVFDRPSDVPVMPTRVPLDSFTSTDLINQIVYPTSTPTPLVELSSAKSGLKLAFDSNQSGVQFYTGNFIKPDSGRKKIHGGSGDPGNGDGYDSGCAAFLEFHEPLAAWLHPATSPSGNDTLLTSDELYNNFVKVDVTYHNPHAL